MTLPYLEVKNVSKQFDKAEIFKDLSFSLKKGEILSLAGPSGTGKSTLLRCLAGLDHFSNGEVLIEDTDLLAMQVKKRPVGMVFQQALLFPHLTLLENVAYGKKITHGKKEAYEMAHSYLKEVGLENHVKQYPHELSGGQQQRAALVRAMLLKPKLLLLDEPFSSLDPGLRKELREWVRSFLKKEEMTSIFVTHDKDEAMLLGDRTAVMAEGRLQQIGLPHELYHTPHNALVAELYSDVIVLDEARYCPAEKASWRAERKDGHEWFEAEWVNETYHFGRRLAHIRLISTGRRITIPAGESGKEASGYVTIPPEAIKYFKET
ncbi:ABC transporter ATP-binding protein [Jeotgalibacillus terrae]|uniref:ABC transporter ATP-binding protein n=1 Tax=Jeotgalibacillus terrae TaxID=587735 RepID=A0ABW5ZED1_9BACL|nr:ABC transporter ATP-binding protein [Jeotgalibacillus terrae]MBM7579476.1 ABC-type Fe3+/spermidine/putrescine transport system ATPase subunit [Jeotgalibacillus terrae]